MANETVSTNEPLEIPSLTDKQLEDLAKIKKAMSATAAKPRTERGITFGFVAQADEQSQMDVLRWLRSDWRYRVVTILHDRDIHDEESIEKLKKRAEKDESLLEDLPNIGDLKKPHYHGIVRISKKITAASFTKRFGGYLHFELLHDSAEYAFYLLHRTFNSQHKTRYDKKELLDDVSLWEEISDSEHDEDLLTIVESVLGYKDENGQISVADILKNNDVLALRSLMSHSYFYNMFVNTKSK